MTPSERVMSEAKLLRRARHVGSYDATCAGRSLACDMTPTRKMLISRLYQCMYAANLKVDLGMLIAHTTILGTTGIINLYHFYYAQKPVTSLRQTSDSGTKYVLHVQKVRPVTVTILCHAQNAA